MSRSTIFLFARYRLPIEHMASPRFLIGSAAISPSATTARFVPVAAGSSSGILKARDLRSWDCSEAPLCHPVIAGGWIHAHQELRCGVECRWLRRAEENFALRHFQADPRLHACVTRQPRKSCQSRKSCVTSIIIRRRLLRTISCNSPNPDASCANTAGPSVPQQRQGQAHRDKGANGPAAFWVSGADRWCCWPRDALRPHQVPDRLEHESDGDDHSASPGCARCRGELSCDSRTSGWRSRSRPCFQQHSYVSPMRFVWRTSMVT